MPTYILDARAATPHFPGIGRYVKNLAIHLPALLAKEERLALIVNAGAPPPWLDGPKQAAQVNLLEAAASPFSLAQQWQIPRLIRAVQDQPAETLYHSPYYLMPYRPGAPTVLTVYDIIPLRYPQTVSRQARALFSISTQLALKTAARVAAISEAARQDFLQTFHAPPVRLSPAQIAAIPLAAEAKFQPQPPAEVERVRQRYGLPERFALYVGINKPHKNLLRLVEAWQRARPAGWRLLIGGAWDARYPQARERAAQVESIHFLGTLPDADLPALYSAAGLFIFPSLYEGFGLPVLEALACGAPVLCSRASSLPEVAGEAALYFDPFQVEDMAGVIQQAAGDAALRAALTGRGPEQAGRFSWRRASQATLELYRQALGQTGASIVFHPRKNG